MASNRYTQLSFNSLNDLPQLQLPYQEIDNLLGQQQGKIDMLNASADLTPKFIQQSEDDRNLAGQIMKYQQDVKAQLAEIAKTGNVNAYMEGLNQAQNQIKKLYSPGGAADVLQQRYNQKEARDKQIDEFYKTNPKLASYYKQTTPYNKVGYNVSTGEYQPINSFGNIKPHVEEKDINTWFNTNLDNVKDSLLKSGVSKSKLDAITSLTDFWQIEGVPKEKLVGVFATLFPKEFQDSLYQEETANKYFSGDTTPVDTNVFIKDEKGNYKLNINNPVGRRIDGYATLGSRQNVKHDRVKDDNELALAAYNSQLRQKEDRLKEGVLRFEGTSAVFNPNVLPSSSKDLEAAKATTQSTIDALQKEYVSTDDSQRKQNISSQIMWNKAILDKQNQLKIKAEEATKDVATDVKLKEYSYLRDIDPYSLSGSNVMDAVAKHIERNSGVKVTEAKAWQIYQEINNLNNSKKEKVDEWLKTNKGQNNFEMNTIGVSPDESTAIKQSLNTNNWTFFDENGPVDNVETSTLLGTKDKPIISQNVTIGGITKAPFGELGNLVTLTDAKGKVYYAASKGGNVGKVIGNNMKNKAPEGSEQWILGHMLSDPSSAGILGQMTDMQDEDSRIIVSGPNSLGKVEKKQVASGTLFTLHAPDGVVFPNGKTTMDYNNMENLTNDLQIINNSLNGTTGN